jgi:7,8-dihydropterin-6-yl-methyl-4-(beta-D-ribofuranosyl)aminobenzene 5'-phosphate synthase
MGLLAEHGLSMLVEGDGWRILFDTGQTTTAVHNARAMRLDLGSVDTIALSHGHADHTGGLQEILSEVAWEGRDVEVIGHPDIWASRFAIRRNQDPYQIGIPFPREELEGLGARFRLEKGPVEIAEGVMLTGEVPRVTPFEHLDADLKVPDGDGWRQDELLDDQSLIVRTGEGLVVILGCAHSGMINTLRHAQQLMGEERILAVVGGTHLGPASPEQFEETVMALQELGVQKLGVSHCTGLAAAARLFATFGPAFFFNVAGTVVEFP